MTRKLYNLRKHTENFKIKHHSSPNNKNQNIINIKSTTRIEEAIMHQFSVKISHRATHFTTPRMNVYGGHFSRLPAICIHAIDRPV